ncbi:MAG: response regulator [Spirulinaceae cyanobacterium]
MNSNPLNPQSSNLSPSGMSVVHSPTLNVVVELTRYSQQHFTGKLDIKVRSGSSWSLYLHLGRLAWVTGGKHPRRRWQRHYKRYCSQVDLKQLQYRRGETYHNSYYPILGLLISRKLVSVAKIAQLQQALVSEVLFDLIQEIAIASVTPSLTENTPQESFTITATPGVRPCRQTLLPQATLINLTQILCQVETQWNHWVAAGLTRCSPDLAPVVGDRAALQQITQDNTYQRLQQLINGKNTLRDLAAIANTSVLALTRSLLPYIRQQLIGLVQVGDLVPSPSTPAQTPSYRPLAIGVDDNEAITIQMRSLLSQAGYRFIGVNNATQVLTTILETKPDLIFLDLVMPIANGYEICAQIRRIRDFQDTPVIILTNNDGLIDRVRAKMVGATDFLSKPLVSDQIHAIAQKYLTTNNISH